METEIYKIFEEYIFKPLIGYLCGKLWDRIAKRIASYKKRYQSAKVEREETAPSLFISNSLIHFYLVISYLFSSILLPLSAFHQVSLLKMRANHLDKF